MLKRLLIGVLLILCARTVYARQRYWNYCMKGGEKPVTQGLTATHPFQRTYASCTVHVYQSGTLNLATLYSDNLSPLSTPLANPFTSAADGYFEFYAVAGRYDIQITDVPSGTSYTWGDVILCDPLGPLNDTDCTVGGAAGAHNLLSATHPDTVPYSPPNQGDMIRANSNLLWERFARGTASQFLSMDATGANYPIWQDFNFYGDSTTPFNSSSRMGINIIGGTNVTVTTHDDPAHNRAEYTISASAGGAIPTLPMPSVCGSAPIPPVTTLILYPTAAAITIPDDGSGFQVVGTASAFVDGTGDITHIIRTESTAGSGLAFFGTVFSGFSTAIPSSSFTQVCWTFAGVHDNHFGTPDFGRFDGLYNGTMIGYAFGVGYLDNANYSVRQAFGANGSGGPVTSFDVTKAGCKMSSVSSLNDTNVYNTFDASCALLIYYTP